MKRKLRRLYWRWFGRPDVPPKDFKVMWRRNPYTGERFYNKSCMMAGDYLAGSPIEVIAKQYNVTRERVRQIIWKEFFSYERRYHDSSKNDHSTGCCSSC